MDTLSKSLYSVVSQSVDEFSQIVASKYNVSKEEVLELWNSKVSSELKVVETKEKKPSRPRTTKSAEAKDDSATCSYEFKKGKNSGTKCTARVCADSSKYCRKHKSQDDKEETGTKTEKKAAPKATSSKAKKSAEAKEKETAAVKKLSDTKSSLVIRRNKHGNYVHSETQLVLDKDSKEVYGRQNDSGEIDPLTAEDIELCRKFSFKYRLPTTLSSNNQEEDVEDEDIEEEEEEIEDEEDEESGGDEDDN